LYKPAVCNRCPPVKIFFQLLNFISQVPQAHQRIWSPWRLQTCCPASTECLLSHLPSIRVSAVLFLLARLLQNRSILLCQLE
jgi:hypothetical protein